ncbi:MAG: energy transducer TonB [Pseudomonadota bacterium]
MPRSSLILTPAFSGPLSWLAATLIAVVLHLIFFISVQAPSVEQVANDPGNQSIDISLKKILPPPSLKPQKKVNPKTPSNPIAKKQAKAIAKPTPIITSQPVVDAHTAQVTDKEPLDEQLNEPLNEQQVAEQQPVKDQDLVEEYTPSAVSDGGNPDIRLAYEATLLTWLERFKRYPSMAKRRGQKGTVMLDFTIDKAGNVIAYTISEPSPYKSLNKAVEKMLKRASPLPTIPQELQHGKTSFNYVVPVNFELR